MAELVKLLPRILLKRVLKKNACLEQTTHKQSPTLSYFPNSVVRTLFQWNSAKILLPNVGGRDKATVLLRRPKQKASLSSIISFCLVLIPLLLPLSLDLAGGN